MAGPAVPRLGKRGWQRLAELGPRVPHGPGDLLADVQRTERVGDVRPQRLEDLGVKRRAVRAKAAYGPAALLPLALERRPESAAVFRSRVVVENREGQAVVPAVVYHADDAAGPLVDRVEGQVAAAVRQRFLEVSPWPRAPGLFLGRQT